MATTRQQLSHLLDTLQFPSSLFRLSTFITQAPSFNMHPKFLGTVFAACAIVEICVAQSPPRFTPATSNHLTVTYGESAISPAGITVEETGQ
jgi:hypothetical protein